MMVPVTMVGLGEILWDILPSGKKLGGAPTNFAYISNILGNRGVTASRLGTDLLGQEARQRLQSLGVTDEYVQSDRKIPTGTAEVHIDSAGQPTFAIREPAAWDFLQWTPAWQQLSADADVICFGSLAQRSAASAETIERFLLNSRSDAVRIFDVNLRQSYYNPAVLKRSLEHADILKLSDSELPVVASQLGLDTDEKQAALQLIREFHLDFVCITRAERGSQLLSQSECVSHPGFVVDVVDAVGAGDAFTACVAHFLVRGLSLMEISAYANRLASWDTTQHGATPSIRSEQIQALLEDDPLSRK